MSGVKWIGVVVIAAIVAAVGTWYVTKPDTKWEAIDCADRNGVMGAVLMPNQTSASLLMSYSRALAQCSPSDERSVADRKLMLVYDLYIKARSYAVMNKVFFWLAIIAAACVLIWPSMAVICKDLGKEKEVLKSAVVQTTVTALAALTFAFYSHYKNRQVFTENLIRVVVFAEPGVGLGTLAKLVTDEMAKIDQGFSFSGIAGKDDSKQ